MEIASIIEIWKYLKWLPKFILKKVFSKERLADLVLMDVKPRHRSVTVNLGDVSTYQIWFQVINMSPFDIELDGAEFQFVCAGTSLTSHYIKKTEFKSGEVGSLLIQGDIDSGKADQISKYIDDDQAYISLHCEFNTLLHPFTKVRTNLDGVNVKYVNEKVRLKKLENA